MVSVTADPHWYSFPAWGREYSKECSWNIGRTECSVELHHSQWHVHPTTHCTANQSSHSSWRATSTTIGKHTHTQTYTQMHIQTHKHTHNACGTITPDCGTLLHTCDATLQGKPCVGDKLTRWTGAAMSTWIHTPGKSNPRWAPINKPAQELWALDWF